MIDERPVFLYNLSDDPYEYNNIAQGNKKMVDKMMKKLAEYQSTMIPPHIANEIKEGNPNNFNGAWSSGWCESEPN